MLYSEPILVRSWIKLFQAERLSLLQAAAWLAFDKFVIKVNGKGCHGSTPEKGIDPVNIAAHIVIALQAITTRELNATKPLVLTIGKIQGGSQYMLSLMR